MRIRKIRYNAIYLICFTCASSVHAQSASLQTDDLISSIAASGSGVSNSLKTSAYVARLPTGDLIFQSGLALDDDGSVYCKQDPYGQRETSPINHENDPHLDSNAVPYIVLPGPVNDSKEFRDVFNGARMGDVVYLFYSNHPPVAAIVGDSGPSQKLGEASIETFRELGEELIDRKKQHSPYQANQCTTNPQSDWRRDGEEGKLLDSDFLLDRGYITTILFPHTSGLVDFSSPTAIVDSANAIAKRRWELILEHMSH